MTHPCLPLTSAWLCLALTAASASAADNPPPTRLTIDANEQGAVISPLLFGCNLEVTRRAIWRGLGAEMVANRKFAAVTNSVPMRWYPLPDARGAVMDHEVIFVGKGSVRVGGDKPGGLGQQQEALAFLKGTRYTFRWWLKSEAEQRVFMRIADGQKTRTLFQVEKTLKPGDWQLWTGEFTAPVTAENARLVGCTHTAEWNKPLFEQAGTLLSYTSIHEYDGGGLDVEGMSKAPTTSLWPKLQNAIAQRQTQPPIPAILDEWSTGWGKPGTVGTGLNTAGVINLLCREAGTLGIEQAYYFQPVNEGGIRVGPLTARLDTGGKVFAAFKCHQGNRRLKLPPAPADADLDVAASISANGSHVYLTIIHRGTREDRTLELKLTNLPQPLSASVRFLIAKDLTQPTYSSFPIPSGPSAPLVANEVTPQHAIFLEREEQPTVDEGGRLELKMPRYSVAVLELTSGKQ